MDLLLNLKMPPTKGNKEALMGLLKFGLEASRQNIQLIEQLKTGLHSKSSLDSILLAKKKGFEGSTKGVQALDTFLTKNTNISKQLKALILQISKTQVAIKSVENLFSSGLVSGIYSVISDLDKSLKKLQQMQSGKDINIDRVSLVKDLKTFSEFMTGLSSQLNQLDPAQLLFMNNVNNLQSKISAFLENMLSQVILSHHSASMGLTEALNYAYWQIPNPFFPDESIDLLVSQNSRKKIDPDEKINIIMKLETPDLGELGIKLDIQDQKLWVVFHTTNGRVKHLIGKLVPDLKDQLGAYNYQIQRVQMLQKRLNIKEFLVPTTNLNNISRVQTEV